MANLGTVGVNTTTLPAQGLAPITPFFVGWPASRIVPLDSYRGPMPVRAGGAGGVPADLVPITVGAQGAGGGGISVW
jgi:hypothetical protein